MKRKPRKARKPRNRREEIPLTDITGKVVTIIPPAYATGTAPRITARPRTKGRSE
ncbi:hypothetical protein PX52LOC_05785 [Limnoglobus roseus]|uniref:Uncharacterized protein n=1 Tax=Limnoglobus roseus TaxID=2598579 RepID=A0A5C1APF4_9BACT|nr:hypothetical protein PX52LOC_05785 [Limnoglobus roseus]